MERLALNGIGASIPMSADGRVFYYSNYNPHGGEKRNTDFGWSCCTGTRPQAAADCCDLVYFKDKENLYVNLFTPSTVRWSVHDTSVTLRQTTRFPEEPRTQFTVELAQPAAFGLKIRCPAWLAGPITARINGAAADIEKDSQNWAVIRAHVEQRRPGGRRTSDASERRVPFQAAAIPRHCCLVRSRWRCAPRMEASRRRSTWSTPSNRWSRPVASR